MGRRGNSPPMDEPGAPLGGGRGQKYGASPDVRNAVMDYYKQDKKSTTANLSTLMNSVLLRFILPATSPAPLVRGNHALDSVGHRDEKPTHPWKPSHA
eukprot:COSAG01_NODE_1167_length_11440_cov_69.256238_2_plen_98_part_00